MKRKLFLFLAAFTLLAAFNPPIVNANLTKGASAMLLRAEVVHTPRQAEEDNRAEILEGYLKTYNSPLAPHAQTFIDEADKNNIDWRIVPAITGVESYYGQMIPPYSHNGWGFGVYGNNVRRFVSWDEGISIVTTALREEYMDARGAQNIYQIGSTYAADPAWANKVQRFINEIDAYAASHEANHPTISISL